MAGTGAGTRSSRGTGTRVVGREERDERLRTGRGRGLGPTAWQRPYTAVPVEAGFSIMPWGVDARQRGGAPERVRHPARWRRRPTSRGLRRSSPIRAKTSRTTRASSGATSNRAIPPPRSRVT